MLLALALGLTAGAAAQTWGLPGGHGTADFIAAHEAELLARMIPAISGPAGSRAVEVLSAEDYEGGNIDLQGFRNAPWPRPRTDGHDDPWWHRDHRRPAYVYVHGLYETIADEHHLKLK